MVPILARYGSIFIYSYTVLLGLGILVGIVLTARWAKESDVDQWFDALLLLLAVAIVGGRLGYVIFRWDYFQEQVSETWQIWQGGLSYLPALLAGITGLYLWSLFKQHSFFEIAGLFSPALVLTVVFGWAACWMEGCAYGQEAAAGPLTTDLPDDLGVYSLRYHSQAIGLVLTLILFTIIVIARKRTRPGNLFLLTLIGLSVIYLIVGLTRGDPAPELWELRLDVLLNGLILLFALFLLQLMNARTRAAKSDTID
ncbi:MAG: prolipoprotein diacylglyceryl transferase [Candidatus Promineifilaceae bacterium]|nr:prolipoprotein diacylglyceryl transferase [Candidatus Promineifilaceae bacterium]